MTDKSKELVNSWILNELTILQQDYFHHLEKKEINFATGKLIKFTRERLSNEYLELIKISPWDTDTKNTLLFVYQQILIMLHPSVPFITEHIYQGLAQKKILETEIETVGAEDKNEEIWQIDCLLLLISGIRSLQKKSKVSEFYLELVPEWESKLNPSLDFNQYLKPLVKSKIFVLKKEKKVELGSSLDLQPFGVLWYHNQIDKKELEKQLKLYETECQRSQRLLENNRFLQKAPPKLIAEEKKRLIYYQEQKKKAQTELEKNQKDD